MTFFDIFFSKFRYFKVGDNIYTKNTTSEFDIEGIIETIDKYGGYDIRITRGTRENPKGCLRMMPKHLLRKQQVMKNG